MGVFLTVSVCSFFPNLHVSTSVILLLLVVVVLLLDDDDDDDNDVKLRRSFCC